MFAFSSLLKRRPSDQSYAEPVEYDGGDRPPSFGELLAAAYCSECCVVPFDYLLRREPGNRHDDLDNDGRR
ncbi:hypothetical protein MXD81_59500 [Microbacteriaceae bacterium K1510]|nr:hypothetical protein [Microbacteriaceae bacterium K1510]